MKRSLHVNRLSTNAAIGPQKHRDAQRLQQLIRYQDIRFSLWTVAALKPWCLVYEVKL